MQVCICIDYKFTDLRLPVQVQWQSTGSVAPNSSIFIFPTARLIIDTKVADICGLASTFSVYICNVAYLSNNQRRQSSPETQVF